MVILSGTKLFSQMSPTLRSGWLKWAFCRFWQIDHLTGIDVTYLFFITYGHLKYLQFKWLTFFLLAVC